jgi:hypothetical protein
MENLLVITSIGASGVVDATAMEGAAVRSLQVMGNGVTHDESTVANVPFIQFGTKLTSGKFRTTALVNRKTIKSITYQPYVAPVLSVDRIGAATAEGTLACEELKEASITVRNNSYNKTIPTQRVNVSQTRRQGETLVNFLNRVVAELNNVNTQGQKFFTAALVTSSTFYAITITAFDRNNDISIQCGGEFAYQTVTRTVEPVVGYGVGADIVALEKEQSKHLGNHGYVELTDLWYNAPTEALASENYHVFNMAWDGVTGTASSSMVVANNTLTFAIPTTAVAIVADLENLLQSLGGSVYQAQALEDVIEEAATPE